MTSPYLWTFSYENLSFTLKAPKPTTDLIPFLLKVLIGLALNLKLFSSIGSILKDLCKISSST